MWKNLLRLQKKKIQEQKKKRNTNFMSKLVRYVVWPIIFLYIEDYPRGMKYKKRIKKILFGIG